MTKKQSLFPYSLQIFWSNHNKCYVAQSPEVPEVVAPGRTWEEAGKNAFEALKKVFQEKVGDGEGEMPFPVTMD